MLHSYDSTCTQCGLGYVLSNGQCDDLGFVTLPVDTPSWYLILNQEYAAPWLSTSTAYANTATPTYMQRSLGPRFATNGLPLQIPASVGAPEERITTLRTYSFEMMKHEVTQKLWQAVRGSNPSHFQNCDQCPVESISFWDALKFANELSTAAGLPECYNLSQGNCRTDNGQFICDSVAVNSVHDTWGYTAAAGCLSVASDIL